VRISLVLPVSLETPSGLRYSAMAKALARQGHAVSVLALHHDLQATTVRLQEQDGYRVRYVGQMHVRKVGSYKHYYSTPALLRVALASAWRLMLAAAQQPCDLIHLGKAQPVNGLGGLFAARLRGRPLFLDCDDYEAESNRFGKRWQKKVVERFEDGLPRSARGLTTNTRFMEARLLGLGVRPEQIAYVPNGIDGDRFKAPASAKIEALRRHWDLEGKPVVGYIGTLSLTNHAVDLLLEAFASLHARHSEVTLLVVGGGEDLDRLQNRAAELEIARAVRFVGRMAPDEVPACYAMCDVTVDPVRDDLVARSRSPLKIVESLAVGTPVVTGDVGDRREMVSDGKAGLLVTPGDAGALANGMGRVLFEPGCRSELVAAGHAACEPFYWDRLVERVEALYRKCLGPISS
jgi:glycosyltransferase involved in cell wall biosynthesis